MAEQELVLCEEPGPAKNDPPCVREKDHEGDCYIWHQADNDHVMVYTFDGEPIYHMNIQGKVTTEEVGVLVAFLDYAAKLKKERAS